MTTRPLENARRAIAVAGRKLAHETDRRKTLDAALRESDRHYRELLAKSRRMQEHLRRLSHQILSAQEDERKKISRELHDEIGQALTAINVRLATLSHEATGNVEGIRKKIATTSKRIKRLGLLGMRERVEMVGGSFTVESSPGEGTSLRAQIPFTKAK